MDRPGQTRREAGTQSQGPRFAEAARSPGQRCDLGNEVNDVKANLARFTTALALLATMALSLGAGIRWY